MNIITIILTGFALAMDAFAVSVTKGMTLKNLTKKMAIKIALFFGVFQAAMPLIGWLLGISFQGYIQAIDHWIALILLSILGGKMIYEFYENRKEAKEGKNEAINEASTTLEDEGIRSEELSNKELTTLAIATSIDALAVGISFAFLNVNLILAIALIGSITFFLSVIGTKVGNVFGDRYENKAELFGGVILIFLGIKILLEHLNIINFFI